MKTCSFKFTLKGLQDCVSGTRLCLQYLEIHGWIDLVLLIDFHYGPYTQHQTTLICYILWTNRNSIFRIHYCLQ